MGFSLFAECYNNTALGIRMSNCRLISAGMFSSLSGSHPINSSCKFRQRRTCWWHDGVICNPCSFESFLRLLQHLFPNIVQIYLSLILHLRAKRQRLPTTTRAVIEYLFSRFHLKANAVRDAPSSLMFPYKVAGSPFPKVYACWRQCHGMYIMY